ncbi:MAG: TetR/AcrR family transcriptional regulator [Betaproteobacteria bacterium]|nr:TetR/AcrR family transcriptional regulator [Betaproteobacteria bacterium]
MKKKTEQRRASVEKLLAVALRLFVSQGYRSTTLDQIATAARFSKGAVYFYFGSKDSVLMELLERVRTVVVDDAIRAAGQAGPSAVERIVAFLHNQAKLGVSRRDDVFLLILMSLEFSHRRDRISRCIAGIYGRLHRYIEALIRSGQKSGEIRTDVPVRELAAIVMANHDGAFLEWYRRAPSLNGPSLVRALRSVVLHGVARPRLTRRFDTKMHRNPAASQRQAKAVRRAKVRH